ncbi:MAG: hypothetical protein ACE5HE_03065 [Phycisphaerae bacterium]
MTTMEQSTLIRRLERIRRLVRRRLVEYGLCAVLCVGIASFITILALDWMLSFPAVIRVLIAILSLSGFVAACLGWIVRPVQADLDLAEIAGRLERHFKVFGDRLSSTVSFIGRPPGDGSDLASAAMMERVIANTSQLANTLRLESVVTSKPLVRQASLAIVALLVLMGVLVQSPQWAQTGLYRYVYPFGEIEWPPRVAIVTLTGPQTIALGESATVRMRVARGFKPGLRGIVHIRSKAGHTTSMPMRGDGEGLFQATIDALTEDLDYWFEAGDASTRKSLQTIRVVARPVVVEALATIAPPSYAHTATARTYDLQDGPVNTVIGAHVTLNVRASKPIPVAWAEDYKPAGTRLHVAGLRFERSPEREAEERLVPLTVNPDDHHLLSAQLDITGDMHFRIELRDTEGFANRGGARHSILATPDKTPTVAILEPTSITEVTPQGAIPLILRTSDDFGVTALALHAECLADGRTFSISLNDLLAAMPGEPREGAAAAGVRGEANGSGAARSDAYEVTAAEVTAATVEYTWDMKPLALTPGDVVVYHATATDSFPGDGKGGQAGRSTLQRALIISEVEFDSRVREELDLLAKRIRNVAFDEAELLAATMALIQPGDNPTILSEEQRARANVLAVRQARLIQRVAYLARRFSRLGTRIEANAPGNVEAHRNADRASDALTQVGDGPMAGAGDALTETGEQVDVSAQQALLRQTARDQELAIDRLHALIRTMSEWGSYQWLVSQTRDLFDRQEAIRLRTASLGKTMLGKSVDDLDTTETADLRREQHRQEQLAADVEALLARMQRLHAEASGKDDSGAEAMEAALRAARAGNVAARAHAAAEAIALNRTAAAVLEQKAGAETMRRMLRALHERSTRELAELRKRVQRAEDQVAWLIDQQSTLQTAVREAELTSAGPDAQNFDVLEQEQHGLCRNTRQVADELGNTERTLRTARTLRLAELPMGQAEEYLRDRSAARALPAQDDALELLEDALAQLQELAREAEDASIRRSLDQIREDLESIRTAQLDVNAGISELRRAVVSRGVPGRSEAREAARLARKQLKVRTLLDDVLPDLEKVPVYEWALRRAADWMDVCRGRLDARRVDDQLVATAERIVLELQRLIAAARATEALPVDTEFAEAEGARGGRGAGAAGKPVPTVAELIVLKAMQTEINERTANLYQSIDLDNATEEQLRELKFVGEDQVQVHHLTTLVTQRARHP